MKYIIRKDNLKRQTFIKNEFFSFLLKSLLKNKKLKKSLRALLAAKIVNLPNNSFRTRIVNRCIFTGRKNIISTKYRVSRLQFAELIKHNFIPGLGRYGW